MKQFIKEWIVNNPKFITKVKEIEIRRHLNLISKLNKEKNEINLDLWISEMYFGIFFDSIADKLHFEKKIDNKEPDWTVYRAD